MLGGDVERLEVVIIGLHLGRLDDLEAHRLQDAQALLDDLGERVESAGRGGAAGQRDIHAFLREGSLALARLQRGLAHVEGGLERLLGAIRRLAN